MKPEGGHAWWSGLVCDAVGARFDSSTNSTIIERFASSKPLADSPTTVVARAATQKKGVFQYIGLYVVVDMTWVGDQVLSSRLLAGLLLLPRHHVGITRSPHLSIDMSVSSL